MEKGHSHPSTKAVKETSKVEFGKREFSKRAKTWGSDVLFSNIILLSIIDSLMLVGGQLLWKAGMKDQEFNTFTNIVRIIFTPYILGGLVIYGVATLLWLYILSKAELSYVYPFTSIVQIIMLLCAVFIFKEDVHITRWIGVLLITSGVALVGIK